MLKARARCADDYWTGGTRTKAPMANVSVYEDNQFTYRKPSRAETLAGSPRKLRRHLPLWLDALIVLVVVGAAGAVGYKFTHPSPHHSAQAISSDFVLDVSAGNYTAAASDVDPGDRAEALKTMRADSGVPGGQFVGAHSLTLASQTVTGSTATVLLKACNSELACNSLPPMPCVEVKGQWYVSWFPLLQATTG